MSDKRDVEAKKLAIPIAAGISCFFVNFSILTFIFTNYPWTVKLFFGRGSWWLYQDFPVKVLYVVGVAPVVEEVIHRRFVLQFFLNRSLATVGLIVSSLTFGIHHTLFGWGFLKAVDVFFVGLVFGLVYLRYKLVGSWLSHLSNNAMSIILSIVLR